MKRNKIRCLFTMNAAGFCPWWPCCVMPAALIVDSMHPVIVCDHPFAKALRLFAASNVFSLFAPRQMA